MSMDNNETNATKKIVGYDGNGNAVYEGQMDPDYYKEKEELAKQKAHKNLKKTVEKVKAKMPPKKDALTEAMDFYKHRKEVFSGSAGDTLKRARK